MAEVKQGECIIYTRVPDLSIKEHVELAHAHTQRALDLAYADERQKFRVRQKLGKAQALLITLLVHNKLQ